MNQTTSSDSTVSTKLTPAIIKSQVANFKGGPTLVDGLVWAILDRCFNACGEGEYARYMSLIKALTEALAFRKAARDGHLTAAKLWASMLVKNTQVAIGVRNQARLATKQLAEFDAIEREYEALFQPAPKPIKAAPPKKPRMKPVAGNSFAEKLATLGAQAS